MRQVLVANTVPREALMHAVAMSSMAFNSGGPPGRVGAVPVLARIPTRRAGCRNPLPEGTSFAGDRRQPIFCRCASIVLAG